MKTAKVLFGSVVIALLAGCAGSLNQTQPSDSFAQRGPSKSSSNDPDEIVCEMERSVGSNIPEKVCRTRRSIEGERDATQIMMQTMGNKNRLQGN